MNVVILWIITVLMWSVAFSYTCASVTETHSLWGGGGSTSVDWLVLVPLPLPFLVSVTL